MNESPDWSRNETPPARALSIGRRHRALGEGSSGYGSGGASHDVVDEAMASAAGAHPS